MTSSIVSPSTPQSDNSSVPASFVLPKTTAQTQLTLTNHTKPPFTGETGLHRPEEEVDEFVTVNQTDVGESAKKILRNVKQEDEQDTMTGGRKKVKLFGRRSNSQVSDSSANEKMFAKLGIVLSQSPAPVRSVVASRQSVDLSSTLHRARPPMLSKAHSRTNTMPNIHSEGVSDNGGADSPSRPRSYHVTAANLHPPQINIEDSPTTSRGSSPTTVSATSAGVEMRSSTPMNQDGYDVITMVDVASDSGGVIQHVQPSPPISLKSEPSHSATVHSEHTSSPDSGYGNTPGSDNNSLPRRRKRSPQDSMVGTATDNGAQVVSGGVRAKLGELSALNHDSVRTRGSTSDSVYSLESTEPNTVLPPSNSRRDHQPLKPVHSAPLELNVRRNDNMDTLVAPGQIPVQAHPGQFQLHMSHGTEVLPYSHRTEFKGHGRRANSVIPSSASLGDVRKLKDEPGNGEQQDSSRQQRDLSPGRRRRKYRSGSHAFSKSAEVRSHHVVKTSTLPAQLQDEKDYFQVTDQLGKENAHFALSEALLAVVEQYKANCCEQDQQPSNQMDPPLPLSPPPIPVDNPDTGGMWAWSPQSGSTPPGGIPSSMTSWGSMSSVATTDDPYDGFSPRRIPRISLLALMRSSAGDHSAESTSQKLLQHMAAKLTGITSEEMNLSQMELKLPTDFLTSLQLDDDLRRSVTTSSSHIRGSKEWAPPRKQLIYHIKQPSRNLQKDLEAQHYRCTGCGMQVDSSHARNFRFCNYTGKYFCQNCHTNATSVIPAHILEKWSFKRLYVSNFARDFLNKIYMEPVLTVPNSIYNKVPIMAQTRDLRKQLVSIRQYLKTCRRSQSLRLTFDGHAPWTTDVHTYALDDFYEIKGGTKLRQLKSMLSDAIEHVKSCPICMGKGFVCEFCQNSNDIIFPFEVGRVVSCENCKCCFHKECSRTTRPCPRCTRIKERQRRRVAKLVFQKDEDDEEDQLS